MMMRRKHDASSQSIRFVGGVLWETIESAFHSLFVSSLERKKKISRVVPISTDASVAARDEFPSSRGGVLFHRKSCLPARWWWWWWKKRDDGTQKKHERTKERSFWKLLFSLFWAGKEKKKKEKVLGPRFLFFWNPRKFFPVGGVCGLSFFFKVKKREESFLLFYSSFL